MQRGMQGILIHLLQQLLEGGHVSRGLCCVIAIIGRGFGCNEAGESCEKERPNEEGTDRQHGEESWT